MNWTRNIFLVALCHIFIVQSFLAIAGEPMETDMPLRRYAEAGNPALQITLGVYYLEGKQGLPVDPAEGVKWLGLREKGFAWLERAATLGDQSAILTLERLRKKAVKTDAGTTDRTEEERR